MREEENFGMRGKGGKSLLLYAERMEISFGGELVSRKGVKILIHQRKYTLSEGEKLATELGSYGNLLKTELGSYF